MAKLDSVLRAIENKDASPLAQENRQLMKILGQMASNADMKEALQAFSGVIQGLAQEVVNIRAAIPSETDLGPVTEAIDGIPQADFGPVIERLDALQGGITDTVDRLASAITQVQLPAPDLSKIEAGLSRLEEKMVDQHTDAQVDLDAIRATVRDAFPEMEFCVQSGANGFPESVICRKRS